MSETASLSGKDIVRRIKYDIDMNYFNSLSLSVLSDQYSINANYLSNLFQSEVGSSFVKYLTSVRMEKAKQYLKYTDFSMEKITELVGYSDRGYFSKLFKEVVGVSPSDYRRISLEQAASGAEEYVYVAVFRNDPLMLEQDMYGLIHFAREHNVRALIEAPEEYDKNLCMQILDCVIRRRPAGIMVCASDDVYIPQINEAVDKGIPTITVDCDASDSKRLATVSSNWSTIGQDLAHGLAKSVGNRGKVAVLDMIHSENMRLAYGAFSRVMADHPNIELLGEYDDMSSATRAELVTNQILDAHPDLVGIAGFDSRSAIGACAAIRKAGLRGKVKVVSVDMTSQHISLLRDGYIDMLLGQKRALFTYYGGQLLYACNHSKIELSKYFSGDRFSCLPKFIDTGCITLTRDNIDECIANR